MDKPKWRQEFNALPEWVKKMVRALADTGGYGGMNADEVLAGFSSEAREKYEGFHVLLRKEAWSEWFSGFVEMRKLAAAMTAPWPPAPAPVRETSLVNLVELAAGTEDSAFDQSCAFGYRVDCHAVYCHNEAWPDHPRKCRRSWYTGGEIKDEDCPGYTPNPAYRVPLFDSTKKS